MFPLLEGVRILEIGQSDSARYCGKILAELGAEVLSISNLKQRNDSNQQLNSREVFDQYLDQNKEVNSQVVLENNEEIISLARESELCIVGYESKDLSRLIEDIIANGTSVISITPFGYEGPKSNNLGGDLIASHSSAYAYHVAFPSTSPRENPPKRGPEGQSLLFAGIIGAVSAVGALIGRGKGQPPTLIDLSEQEAVASLLFEELAAYNDGHLPATRKVDDSAEGSAVAGGLVGILPCIDGFVIFSPREQHQWDRVVEWLESPIWAELEQFSTPRLRMDNWAELQKYLSEYTCKLKKEQVFAELQKQKVACFPVNSIKDIFSIEQVDDRGFWNTFNLTSGNSVTVPGLPFLIKSVKNNMLT